MAASAQPSRDRIAAAHRLWPWHAREALAAVVGAWILIAVVLWGTNRWMDWPNASSGGSILYLATAVGLTPVWLLLVDYLARRNASVATRLFTLDFSNAGARDLPAARLASGIGFRGAPITDSSAQLIHRLLNDAATSEAVEIDLGSGEEWWTTRLFALCAGARERRRPNVVVFLGEIRPGDEASRAFLGWVRPANALLRMLDREPDLKATLDRARAIAQQVTMFAPADLRLRPPGAVPVAASPPVGAPPMIAPAVANYIVNPSFQNLGEETFLRLLLELLGQYEQQRFMGTGSPSYVTTGYLHDVLGDVVCRDAIDVTWPGPHQLRTFLDSTADYVAVTRAGVFEGLLPRAAAESDLLRQLLIPLDADT